MVSLIPSKGSHLAVSTITTRSPLALVIVIEISSSVTIDELYPYVSDNVARASGQEQHPVKKGMVEGRFVFGVVR